MERQRHLALHLGKWKGCAATLSHNQTISRLSQQKCFQGLRHYAQKMRVNRASTILDLSSWKIEGL